MCSTCVHFQTKRQWSNSQPFERCHIPSISQYSRTHFLQLTNFHRKESVHLEMSDRALRALYGSGSLYRALSFLAALPFLQDFRLPPYAHAPAARRRQPPISNPLPNHLYTLCGLSVRIIIQSCCFYSSAWHTP